MATPTVPPRPSRASANAPSGPTAVMDNLPPIPARPTRKMDPSPNSGMRSPFNELPNPIGGKRLSASNLTPDVPPRPPSVSLPSVGQEGSEYASFDQLPAEAHGVRVDAPVEQTRNVAANMPLHAPRASVPQSTAKSRIETVTRTDSTQAAAAGIGRAKPADDVHTAPHEPSGLSRVTTADDPVRVPSADLHPLRSKQSWNRSTPNLYPTTSRPGSINEGHYEHGIPEIGMQIPLNPNAGDAQAPSPAPTQSQFAPGIGFYNDGSRAHHRRRSSQKVFGPPGSFGMHGHGEEPSTQFEREWIRKHPEQAAVEGFNYHGPARPETALTSAQLNMLVNQTNDAGMGAHPDMIGTPDADIAWEATQEYTSRMTSPKPSPLPTSERKKRSSSGNQPPVASPLRKQSFPFNQGTQEVFMDDGSVIHIDEPARKVNKVTGGGPVDDTLDLGPRGGNTAEEGGWFDERGDGTPILASDEIMKRPGSAFMQPAVSPAEHHNDDYYESDETSRRNSLRIPSRPSSRPNSMHGEYTGGNLHRFISHDDHHGSGMHTPLEEIEEYEPLIPEEEEMKPKPKAVKRPRLEHHHFPSQDTWEDTPMSLQYSTTVETPEPPREAIAPPPPAEQSSAFETPEEEQARREQNPNDMFNDSKTLVNKPHSRALEADRPGVQRFPSQDIWEDTPESMRLVTTVSGPQMDEAKSPPDDRPSTTGIEENSEDESARATTGFTRDLRPSIPTRPVRKSRLAEEIKPEDVPKDDEQSPRETSLEKPSSPDKAKAPALPERPKPSVPARPARTSRGVADAVPPSELAEPIAEPVKSPPLVKAKPAIPARPGGEKIAALKSGFMNDLNNRLKLGPQAAAPKTRDIEPDAAAGEEAEKAPLVDARKSRAKGPARRKPASSPSAAAADTQPVTFALSTPQTTWHIDPEHGALAVPALTLTPPTDDAAAEPVGAEQDDIVPALEKQMSLNESANTAEPPLAEPVSPETAKSPPPALMADPPTSGATEAPPVVDPPEEIAGGAAPGTAVTTAGEEAREIASPPPPAATAAVKEDTADGIDAETTTAADDVDARLEAAADKLAAGES